MVEHGSIEASEGVVGELGGSGIVGIQSAAGAGGGCDGSR